MKQQYYSLNQQQRQIIKALKDNALYLVCRKNKRDINHSLGSEYNRPDYVPNGTNFHDIMLSSRNLNAS
jgi:hypothetical protein